MRRLAFAAKAPLPGGAKTRLAEAIGADAAARLYGGFLRDLAGRFRRVPFEVEWHAAPGAWPHLAPIVGPASRMTVQRGGTWAERQRNFFAARLAAGPRPLVLVATDSPQLAPARAAEAFAALAGHDLVFGPTLDGGYYLVGMSKAHDVFEPAAMSTRAALDSAIARARGLGASVALLEPEFDVDTAEDLPLLREAIRGATDMDHTAAALEEVVRFA